MRRKRSKKGEPHRFLVDALGADTDNCVLWPFAVGSHGYGVVRNFFDDNKVTTTHRTVLIVRTSSNPPDKDAEHICGNRLCVNKRHLRWASRLENIRRKKDHGVQTFGETHHTAKITEAEAVEIRASAEPSNSLARQYGISRWQVNRIKSGENWKHVE